MTFDPDPGVRDFRTSEELAAAADELGLSAEDLARLDEFGRMAIAGWDERVVVE